ncbi:xylulokinase (plasmid) [Skermanella mucosa]|uniref:xylulokinase n=1 Tax=Skermanella mucosa TaxID=1789672 RepID=UPI00192BCCB8|nr:xylulokinase [Skermanella mucosa]UEM25022.1 xylulokinase [Skermanella mucosa]
MAEPGGAAWLGIDIGTSAVKVVLVDGAQAPLATAAVPLATSRPHPLWSEQHPDLWWRATQDAVAELRRAAPGAFAAVAGIGLSGQMHGAVLLDAADRPLRPAILWNDGRAAAECAELERLVPGLGRIAGITAMPGLTAPKLLWVRRHEPDLFGRIRRVMLPKDYVRLKLTGESVTDPSDAAGSLLLDEAERTWSPALLAACGLGAENMPRLAEGTEPAGTLSPAIAREWGLAGREIAVAGGAGDAAAGAVGIGAIADGDAFISLGTSAQIFVTTGDYRPAPETLIHGFAHTLPDTWFQMAALLNGASTVEWAARLVGSPDIGELLARTEAGFRGPGRLLFLPYLAGERTPHDDPHARGVLFGLAPDTGPTDVMQAVLEGVALSLREARDCLAAAGTRVDRVAIIGGGARSPFWTRIIASALGIPVTRYAGSEAGPAFGAARLARIAVTGEAVADVCVKPPVLDVTEPDPALHAAYGDGFVRFRRLYRALREEFRA